MIYWNLSSINTTEQMIVSILWFRILWIFFLEVLLWFLSFQRYFLIMLMCLVVLYAQAIRQICHENALSTFRYIFWVFFFRTRFPWIDRGLNLHCFTWNILKCSSFILGRTRFSRSVLLTHIFFTSKLKIWCAI